MKPLTIDIQEFCHLVGLGRTKTYELLRRGRIQRVKIGRRTLITMESAEALIAQSKVGPE